MELLDEYAQIKEFGDKRGSYRPLSTADGSLTLHSGYFDEAFHSLDGARGETRYNFVEGCGIPSRSPDIPFCILEVGLGMGRGYTETVRALGANFDGQMTFVSLEIDPILIQWCGEHVPLPEGWERSFPSYGDLRRANFQGLEYRQARQKGIELVIIPGDATVTLPLVRGLIPPVDAIYQDAFSPRKNPELWTADWFRLLKTLSSPGVILSTYSVSSSVKEALCKSGFSIRERPGFGGKRASLLGHG